MNLVPVSITRRHCREAARHRRDFNEGKTAVFDWSGNCPAAQAIKEYNNYESVSVQDRAVVYRETPTSNPEQFYMAKDIIAVLKETDSFVENEGWAVPGEKAKQVNGNALYGHLQDKGMLSINLKERE